MKTYNNLKYFITNDFPEKGVTFVDFTPTLTDISSLIRTSDELISLVDGEIDYIIAPDARGFIWGMAIAKELNAGFIPVRKEGKLPKANVQSTARYDTEYSSTALDLPIIDLKGKNCLFVDDVYATGGTYKACKKMVKECGGNMTQGIVLYNILLDDNKEIKHLVTPNELF